MSDDLAFDSVVGLRHRLIARELSVPELVEFFLERCARLNDHCRAFITVTGERARARAASMDGQGRANSLAGIPYGCKDLIDVRGVVTTGGSRVLADNVATADACVVERMEAHGAVLLGKTNLHEFAYGATGENTVYGTPVNAYDATRLACGSSSGSAASVAHGLCPAAFGTDTGGSVRVPAVVNGLVGFKPTHDLISTRGVLPYCWTLDHVGTITRTVADAALLLDTVVDRAPEAAPRVARSRLDALGSQSVSGLRVGVPRRFYFERGDPEILDCTEAVLAALEAAGARPVEVELPSMEHARTVSLTVQMPEALSCHGRWLDERGDLYGADFRAGLAAGQCLLAEHYVRARRFIEWYRRATDRVLSGVDLLITPAAPIIAPRAGQAHVTIDGVEEPVGNALTRYTTFFNMTAHPAITVPCGMHSEGLPMGVQLVGRHFEEDRVLAVADWIDRQDRFRVPPPEGLE